MSGKRWSLKAIPALLAVVLAGCASQAPAPIEQKNPLPSTATAAARKSAPVASAPRPVGNQYRVQAGDTLYSIAWRLGVDYRALASWNGIKDPHHIVVGQVLKIPAPAKGAGELVTQAKRMPAAALHPRPSTSPLATEGGTSSARKVPAEPAAASAPPSPASNSAITSWAWPADGKVSRSVSATGSIGLEIRGQRGQTVRAANRGQVVYSGSGLRGYGQLLIIKHDDTFLSAYAHNDKLLVTEGQSVDRGQPVALMGDSGASEVMLHFEIRKGGKAVEPLQFLPKR